MVRRFVVDFVLFSMGQDGRDGGEIHRASFFLVVSLVVNIPISLFAYVVVKFRIKKALQTCKPDSVCSPKRTASSFIWENIHTFPLAAYPPRPVQPEGGPPGRATRVPLRRRGLHGISTREVYPRHRLPAGVVRSYRTFSPLPRHVGAVIFCDTRCIPTR